MSSFTGFRALTKRSRKEKSAAGAEDLRKVTIVGSLHDVNLPPASDAVKEALLNTQSTRKSKKTDLDKTLKRHSQSETALNRIPLHRSASDDTPSLSKRATVESLARHCSQHTSKKGDPQADYLSAAVPNDRYSLSCYSSSPLPTPLSLDIPKMGPRFGIEEFLRETRPVDFDLEDSSEASLSVSPSSSPEIWESKTHYCSSATSNSSLRSDALLETSSSEAKSVETSNTSPSIDSKKTNDDDSREKKTSQPEAEQVTFSQKISRKQKQYFKQKPLPPVPNKLNTSGTHHNTRPSIHIANLASRYSPNRSDSPVDRLIGAKAADKTLSEATHELERELDMISHTHKDGRSSRRTRSPKKDGNTVAPLKVSSKSHSNPSTKHAQRPSESQSRNRSSTRKQKQTYKMFPPPTKSKSMPVKKEKITTPENAHKKSNSTDLETIKNTATKQAARAQASPSTKFPRKLRTSVHLPSLRRPKISPPIQTKNVNKTGSQAKSPVMSLRDEQAALARSTDRYIDAEIAKALNVAFDEDEDENDEIDDYSSIHSPIRSSEEGEWSTIYPLKAVKKLGIPLMTSSHIPRLSYSESSERALRENLPKLETASRISAAIQNGIIPLPRRSIDRSYPETPDDIQRIRSLIMDSMPAQSLPRVKELVENDPKLGNDKIFIRFDRIESVPKDTSPSTQEVPLIIEGPGLSAAAAVGRPRAQSTLYELDEYGSTPVRATFTPMHDHVNLPMPSQMADKVVLTLMMSVDNLQGLFNYAQVNKQFYRVFKNNELSLIKNALFNMNPPAWELRQMSPPWSQESNGMKDPDAPVPQYTPSSYLQHYARDVFVLAELKTLILARCGSFVRPETIHGLTGEDDIRASEIDEAFWRIWTFCRIFGCGKNREGDINGQIDWLNAGVLAKKNKAGATVITAEPFFSVNNVLFDPPTGFGIGNADGLTSNQLYDMTEIWNCLGTLVQAFHHECKEARVAGIFDGLDINVGDISKEEPMLEEWTHYLLTLGPSALVGLSSVFPTSSIKQQFAKAKQIGVTKWEAPEDGGSRSSFLRDAISRTYERRMAETQLRSASPSDVHLSDESRNVSPILNQHAPQQQPHQQQQQLSPTSFLDEPSGNGVPPYTAINTENPAAAMVSDPPPPRYSSTFLDPVDRAIHRIVHDLGFSEHDAKWALKITDTGDMIDTHAAIQLLQRERKKRGTSVTMPSRPGNRGDCLVDTTKHRGTVAWQWA